METKNGVATDKHDAALIGGWAAIAAVVLIASQAVLNWIPKFTAWVGGII